MKKAVGVYLLLSLIILGAFLVVYFRSSEGLTGFAVFQQSAQSDFDLGNYTNTIYNGSVVTLTTNQTSGDYTSKIFDAGNSSTWDNLTYVGSSDLSFQVRNCSSSDCAGSNFTNINLNNIGLSGQYFQYKVFLTSNNSNISSYLASASSRFTPIVSNQSNQTQIPSTTLSITEPSGTKNTTVAIPIIFTYSGANLTCLYNVYDSTNHLFVKDNTTLTNCLNSTTFNLGAGNGGYVFNLYADGSTGPAHQTSSFTIALPSSGGTQTPTADETKPKPKTKAEEGTAPAPTTAPEPKTELTVLDIASLSLKPGDSQDVKISAKNTGNMPLSACAIKSDSTLLSIPEDSKNINPGDSVEYSIRLSLPSTLSDGANKVSISVECFETNAAKEFTVSVTKIKLFFNVTNTERPTSGRVRVTYLVQELVNQSQNVSVHFDLFDGTTKIANLTQNTTLKALQLKELTATMPINSSLSQNASLTLKTQYTSSVYSGNTEQSFKLGAPTGGILGGFAVIGTGGTAGVATIVIAALVLLVLIVLVVRKIRKGKQ